MKYKDIIKTIDLNKGINSINLEYIYPIIPIEDESLDVNYYIDDEKQTKMMDSFYANKLIITALEAKTLDINIGKGYFVEKNEKLTNKFVSHHMWSGGDGIYSFNLTNGNDSFDQKQDMKTLFVFGDTFVGRSDKETHQRFQPHLMPNNSLAYMKEDHIEFKLNWQSNGEIQAFYKMDDVFDEAGTIAQNLVTYDQKSDVESFVSGYHPKQLELTFDFHKSQFVSHLEVFNYFSKESNELSKRGLKNIVILGSNDLIAFDEIKKVTLNKSESINDYDKIGIHQTYRYIKFVVDGSSNDGNYNDQTFDEGLYGLNKVKFYNDQQLYRDI